MRLGKITPGVLIVLTAYAGLSMAGGALLAEQTLHRPRLPITAADRRRAGEAARELGARLDDVSMAGRDSATLRGWLFTPATPNTHSVILLHGIVSNRASMIGAARLFVRQGYRTLAIDARAHGDSGGRFATFGVDESDDLRRWIAWMRQDGAGGCVYTFGQSLGSAHALEASDAPGLCAVVAQSGFASLREITFDRIGQQAGTGPWLGRTLLRPGLEFALLYTRVRYGVDPGAASAAAAVARPGAPILLIHGTDDDNVPVRHAEMLHAANPGRVTLWLVPRAGHDNVWQTAALEYPLRATASFSAHRRMR